MDFGAAEAVHDTTTGLLPQQQSERPAHPGVSKQKSSVKFHIDLLRQQAESQRLSAPQNFTQTRREYNSISLPGNAQDGGKVSGIRSKFEEISQQIPYKLVKPEQHQLTVG